MANFTPEQLRDLETAKRLGLALTPEQQAIDTALSGGAQDLDVSSKFPELNPVDVDGLSDDEIAADRESDLASYSAPAEAAAAHTKAPLKPTFEQWLKNRATGSANPALNDPYVNKPRDTTDDKLRQGLINSWNINRAYLGLTPVAQQPNFDKDERDGMREWLLKRGQLENAQDKTELQGVLGAAKLDKVGGAKAPANVQLNSMFTQERQLEGKMADLQTNKSKFISEFVRNNKDLPDAAEQAEAMYTRSYNGLKGRLADVRNRISELGGKSVSSTTEDAFVDGDLSKKTDAARMAEKEKKEQAKKEENRLKALDKADGRALALYGDYKADPRVKSYNESEGFLNFADQQIAVLEDPQSTPSARALAADSLLKGYERIQNSGTVLLSEKQAIQDNFGIVDKLKGLVMGRGFGDSPLDPNIVQSFKGGVERARKASGIGKSKADAEYRRRASSLRIEPDVASGLFGWSSETPVADKPGAEPVKPAPKPSGGKKLKAISPTGGEEVFDTTEELNEFLKGMPTWKKG